MLKDAFSRETIKQVLDQIFVSGADADVTVKFRNGRFYWDFVVRNPTPDEVGTLIARVDHRRQP